MYLLQRIINFYQLIPLYNENSLIFCRGKLIIRISMHVWYNQCFRFVEFSWKYFLRSSRLFFSHFFFVRSRKKWKGKSISQTSNFMSSNMNSSLHLYRSESDTEMGFGVSRQAEWKNYETKIEFFPRNWAKKRVEATNDSRQTAINFAFLISRYHSNGFFIVSILFF